MYWTLNIQANGPQRANHAAVAIGDNIYTLGGYCKGGNIYTFSGFCRGGKLAQLIDVFCFNTIVLKWYKIEYQKTSESPKACYGHSVVAYNNLIYLWGGQNVNGACSPTLYCFNTKTLSWSNPVTSGHPPKPTDGHSGCVIGDYMYIFGGFEEESKSYSNKVFRISLITFKWESVVTSGFPPSKRDFHSVSVIGNCMYIFGGRGEDDTDNDTYPSEIMYLDTNSMKWSTPFCDGHEPCGRRSHSAVVYKSEIYIIGGFDGVNIRHLNDVFKYNPVNSVWTEMKVRGEPPCPRRRHCSVVVKDSLYLFGGCCPETCYDADSSEDSSDEAPEMKGRSDLFVLEFFPTLTRLTILKIIESQIDTTCLPTSLKEKIQWIQSQPMYTFNKYDYALHMKQN
ncbi:kelch domain-containing protein 3 [Nephila pilipes]|uniref:Kelch domain-containing protein 3 n=1 Tax=Nephila pilipes TaxID=299642 RepID=A0A8X6UVD3_NEPPI|nr:kelch domain-containing protein 3 [Nephila pilipes]